MKVMLRNDDTGKLIAYVPKKDLEEAVVEQKQGEDGQILTLANGWILGIPNPEEPAKLPRTVEAKRLSS
ncbi:MAG: putative nitrogen fixation protein NifT [Symploca sp. SIO3C6]|uniref:Putative nitrogen fixation protein NifT n=1 Tax=Symploca sp. SIO1C4 TaxID=2607765 RepID=A0A6B3NDC6_9CYAN|nr:putative nitrogen fixation protein NifT [Symploca sp. SIO3C6]NER29590.1 putative nitrogen fixation protein NifT [Symploca sp. SIO1C4]NET05811.1 putative nitrogen fixation protein NifT [Symploca sp. SIO2B6]